MTGILHHNSARNVQHHSLDEFDAALREVDPLYDIDVAGAERFVVSLHRLRQYRKQAGLSQQDVAELMGTQQSAISDLETGVCDPQVSTLRRYAAAIGKFTNIEFDDQLPVLRFGAVVEATLTGAESRFFMVVGNPETARTFLLTWPTPSQVRPRTTEVEAQVAFA